MFKRAIYRASLLLDYAAAFAMISLLLVTSASVASRAVFDRPIAGALEASMLLMPVMIFGAMPWVFLKVGHFAMTSLIEAGSGKLIPLSKALQILCGVIVFAMLSVESIDLLLRSIERREYFAGPVNIPVYYSRFFIAVGSLVTAAALVFVMLPNWLSGRDGEEGEAK